MPPTTRRDDEPLRALQERISTLEEIISVQQAKIQSFEPSSNGTNPVTTDVSRAFKASDIPAYSGRNEEKNSIILRAFFYNLRKVGKLCSFSDEKLLDIEEFRLQGKAATWMEMLEANDKKPSTIEELRTIMFKEFVPANEKNIAKIRLMNLKMKSSVEEHISYFQDLVNISQTPQSELYHYFFMSLPSSYKELFTRQFPSQEPDDIHEAYELARTLSLAASWRTQGKTKIQDSDQKTGTQKGSSSNKEQPNVAEKDEFYKSKDLKTWGPWPNSSEKHHYFKVGRCTKCGEKGWSDPDHPCKPARLGKMNPKE